MDKDFEKWNKLKSQIHIRTNRKYFKEREIWWTNLGINVGDEQDGKGEESLRPVVIFKKHSSRLFTALPLSSKIKPEHPFYCEFSFRGKTQSAIIVQVRALDAKRLVSKMGDISPGQFKALKQKFFEKHA